MSEFIEVYSKISDVGIDQCVELLEVQSKENTKYSRIKTCKELWNFQQSKIEKLNKIIEVLKESNDFYGDDDSYRSKNGGHIENKNFHSRIGRDCGRLARKTKQRVKEIEEGKK